LTRSVRAAALLIALAGVIDPAIAWRQPAPLPIELLLPEPYDPTFEPALRIRTSLLERLGRSVAVNTGHPRVILAIGNVVPPPSTTVPFVTIRDTSSPALSAVALPAASSVEGQKQAVSPRFRARGLAGRSTEFVARRGDARIAHVSHRWSTEDETFEPRFEFVSPAPGLDVLRITASTENLAPVALDAPVMVSQQRLRILVFEPRPSWAAGFVRQALEQDPAFDVQSRTNTSKGISTQTIRPGGLSMANPDAFDVLAVGGLEALTQADLERVSRFAAIRGGTVVLLPDARIPDPVRMALDVPVFDEALVDRPLDVHSSAATLRASEFILPKTADRSHRPLATVNHLGSERAAVVSIPHGSGQVIISGLLDGWRFRAENNEAFERFWTGLIADAALQSPPPLAMQIDPSVAAPGQPIRIRATVRETEWSRGSQGIAVPRVTGSIISAGGRAELVRLWPAAAPGVYEGSIAAPAEGRFSLRVESPAGAAETPLLIRTEARTVATDHSPSLTALARSSGGDNFDAGRLDAVLERLAQMDAPMTENRVHPMRSGWWILPFAGLLTAEWTLRRRKGQR
jgi:hypothetical protein